MGTIGRPAEGAGTSVAFSQEPEFRVRLEVFEGPLDLLLFLIRKNELQITEVALARVTSQYLGFIGLFQALRLSLASEYLFLASTLVELKSRLLLPRSPRGGEESDLESASAELIRRLQEHQSLKLAAMHLASLQEVAESCWVRPRRSDFETTDTILELGVLELCFALEQAFRSCSPPRQLEIGLREWSVAEKLSELGRLLKRSPRFDLTALMARSPSAGAAVAIFLAALELVRVVATVRLLQGSTFGPIMIVSEEA